MVQRKWEWFSALEKHRNVNFAIDVLGVDRWRWTILPRRAADPTLIDQVSGTRDQAVAHCQAEIDVMLAREDGALRP
jgi:hypothetical protein